MLVVTGWLSNDYIGQEACLRQASSSVKKEGLPHKHQRCSTYHIDVDTDVIIPARYLNIADPKELASHAMEDIDTEFVKNVKPGDIIVANKNFGCGSSREHAPRVLKDNGVACVIAASFARIFYRNAINIGLPILESAEAAEAIAADDTVSIDFGTGVITDETTGETFQALPFPGFIQNIIDNDGLLNSLKARGI